MLRIMGKLKTDKRWSGIDYLIGTFENKKIHQTMWSNTEEASVQSNVEWMNKHNPGYEFKLDRIKEK